MGQISLGNQRGFEKYAGKSGREEFLRVAEVLVPWSELGALMVRSIVRYSECLFSAVLFPIDESVVRRRPGIRAICKEDCVPSGSASTTIA